MSENETVHVEAVATEKNAIELMERAAIDIQIATAHQYPRSLTEFNRRAKEMVSVDSETAESCIYRRPVGKDKNGRMTFATGESIRLAEIVAACYGNIRVSAIISEMTPTYVKAIGMAHDLETNNAQKAEVVESTLTRTGKPYDERMRVVVAKAAQSKAIRDAIFRVVPKSLCKSITNIARNVIAGSEKPLEERRVAVESWLSKLSIDQKRVFYALNVKGIEEIGNEELELLTGLRTALKDGDITLDEAFPPIQQEVKQGVDALAEKLKKKNSNGVAPAEPDIPPSDIEPEPKKDEPQPCRYYCGGCEKEWDNPAPQATPSGKPKCPYCLATKVLDRQASE